jgi:nitrate reductase beta subunit
MTVDAMDEMYRLLAIARYEDRFVIPLAHAESARELAGQQGSCGLNFPGGPGGCRVHESASPRLAGITLHSGSGSAEADRAGAVGTHASTRRRPLPLPMLKKGTE